ncbi:hypothetical protein CPB83DRAFT_896771 [Crepidotus variabilis]|uniref:Uncharacterized protein n=1 Tax=Crepidotus variabilis TaxID=179855 RepID=A0A9P6EB22_9AGAR|nr:hypothetical protein CPB83DRAFT_896771 [Crepidotus variabilis]
MFSHKPISMFGIAHSFQKDRLRETYIAEYRHIEKDVDAPRQERGRLAMICDHLLDVNIFSSSITTAAGRDRFTPVKADTMDHTVPLLQYPSQSVDSASFKRPVYTSQSSDSFSM